MWVADSNENKIYAYRLSNAAVLSSLSLNGATLSPAFDSSPARYTGTVFGSDIKTTVTPLHTNAIVSISPADADDATAGHQVVLAEGANSIALAVIAANGAAQTYSIIVSRPAPALTGRQAQPRGFQTASVAKEKKESRLAQAAAFSGGVRFVFMMPSTRAMSRAFEVEASSRLVGGGAWRLLQPGEEYSLVWKDNQDGTAHVTLTLPQPNANQSFLRLKPTN